MHSTTRKFIPLILILFILSACSQAGGTSNVSSDETLVPLMVLPSELNAVSSSLTSSLTVYSTTVTQIYHKQLTIQEDSDGNGIVSSPPLTLRRNNHYRFVVVFYWNGAVFAYVDTVLQVSNAATTNLSYDDSDIVYSTDDPNSDIISPSIYEQTSETLAISDLSISRSEEDNTLSIDATINTDETNLLSTLVLSENNEDFLTLDLSDEITCDNGVCTLSTTIDTENFPTSDFDFYLEFKTATEAQASLSTAVELVP